MCEVDWLTMRSIILIQDKLEAASKALSILLEVGTDLSSVSFNLFSRVVVLLFRKISIEKCLFILNFHFYLLLKFNKIFDRISV